MAIMDLREYPERVVSADPEAWTDVTQNDPVPADELSPSEVPATPDLVVAPCQHTVCPEWCVP